MRVRKIAERDGHSDVSSEGESDVHRIDFDLYLCALLSMATKN